MATEQDLKQLHDKATRGLALAAEEQASLDAWYARLDREEASALAGMPNPKTLATLRAEIDALTCRLVRITERIQATAAESDSLRRDLAALQNQVIQRSKAQPP